MKQLPTTRAVFLDRDGVVNRAILREAGFALILITNQPDIARGTSSTEQVTEINDKLQQYLQLDDVRVCPHDDADRCVCRKPRPGLLLQAARRWNIGGYVRQ